MSTGPGPTPKAEGSADASVDDIADLLVEDESSPVHIEGEQILDDGLDVMLETPGPVLVNTFMPPPPAPAPGSLEETENSEDSGAGANLAYEDLLAKLVLPAKAPEPEAAMPALASSLPVPESLMAPVATSAVAPSLAAPFLVAPSAPQFPFKRPSSSSFQIAPPTDELTLVTDNPLVAEEQEAAVREGRAITRDQPVVVGEEMHTATTEPIAAANGGAKSRLLYLMLGGLLVLGGMILAVLVLKLLMPTPAPQPTVVVTPALPPPPPAPPAHVEPLPPSAPPAAPVPAPAPAAPSAAAAPEAPAATAEPSAVEAPQPKARRSSGHTKAAHASTPKPAPSPKVVTAPASKAAPAPKATPAPTPAAKAGKPAGGKKSGKGSSYADPFDN